MEKLKIGCWTMLLAAILAGGFSATAWADGADKRVDQRNDVSITAHYGLAIDNFAADATKTYLNFNDAGNNTTRQTFGFDMAYRLLGSGDRDIQPAEKDKFFNGRFNPQLWVYGRTMHGMRSAEVDCNAHPKLAVCSNQVLAAPNPNNNLYVLRNASSLEAHLGLRYEFLTLQAGGDSPANLYINAQLGFLSVKNNSGDVVDMHKVGIGAMLIKGPFMNSFLEVGYGRTDLFSRHRARRFKVAAKAVWHADSVTGIKLLKGLSLFAKINADTDLGDGADNIQSYLGVAYSLDKVAF